MTYNTGIYLDIIVPKRMVNDVWDKNTPVEQSFYIHDDETQFFNLDNLKFDERTPTMIDLFCGAGGFSVGCGMAGFQPIIGIDHFEPAMKTWCHNHPHSIGCLGDIRKIEPSDIRKLLISHGVNRFDLLTGGVPCQGFSKANRKHNDFDERNFLFLDYMKYVKEFSPDFIILENVSGMRTTAEGRFEKDIVESMNSLDYTVSVQLLNAADYGVPQTRQRLIFVGVKNNTRFEKPYVFPRGEFINHPLTVRDAISDLPSLDNGETCTEYSIDPQTDYQKQMRQNVGTRLYNHSAPKHPVETVKRIRDTSPGEPMYNGFKQRIRLNYDMPSPTQLAGGIRPQFQFGHPEQPRGLSIRERARIQSFPDDYVFMGGTVQERVQTGNAVPPLLVYSIVKPIYNEIMAE